MERTLDFDLATTIRRVRVRWRVTRAVQGVAIALGLAAVMLLGALYLLHLLHFTPGAIVAMRVAFYTLIALAAVWFVGRPLTRRVSDHQVALYIEEHEPSLDAALTTAVEHAPAALSTSLVRRLIDSALERLRLAGGGARIDRGDLYRASGSLAAIALVVAAVIALGPSFLRDGARALLSPFQTAEAAVAYTISVSPGNASLARGADLQINARLNGFDAEQVELSVRRGTSTAWERVPMAVRPKSNEYAARLFDLDSAAEYYVEGSGVRSPVYKVTVADLPYAKKLDLEYRYPAYTALPSETVEDGGDIAALKGTVVVIHVTPTMPTSGGRILVEGAQPAALAPDASGRLTGSIRVMKPGFYKIELLAADGQMVPASLDYNIDVLADTPPAVHFTKPGRDTKVTAVEEVAVEVKADDDYGVAKLELVYSVNGTPPQTIALQSGKALKEVTAGHTFFLEELKLQPGDIVSYYARATDGDPFSGPKVSATDIYFLRIRPFGQDYRQQQGGGGGGGGGEDPSNFSARQRDIISGTFKTVRDKATTPANERKENLTTLHLAQGKLREQVEALVARIKQRGGSLADSTLKMVLDELPKAASEMEAAEGQLVKGEADPALPPEERALRHLERAEAAFRDVQVAMGQQGGGGGGGKSSVEKAEDLADLFDLNVDKLKNQYESVDRAAKDNTAAVDETLEKLKKLAARQQQENERLKKAAQALRSQSGGGGGGGSDSQRDLAQETEEMARKLERLAREKPSPEIAETARKLQDAANEMKKSASTGGERGAAQGAAALKALEDARRLLDEKRSAGVENDAKGVADRAEQLANEQRAIAKEMEKLGPASASPAAAAAATAMAARKDSLAKGVGDLQSQLDRLARDARREKADASRQMQAAANAIRDNRIKDKINFSKNLLRQGASEYAKNLEGSIASNLDEVRDKVASAAGAARDSGGKRTARTLEKARDLVRGIESLDERMRQRASGQRQPG
ncbi:MAG: DUF4175 family protein, partial [Gemmatimonadaceae bacterium]